MNLVFTAPPSPETPLRAQIRDAHRGTRRGSGGHPGRRRHPGRARDRIAATARRLVERCGASGLARAARRSLA